MTIFIYQNFMHSRLLKIFIDKLFFRLFYILENDLWTILLKMKKLLTTKIIEIFFRFFFLLSFQKLPIFSHVELEIQQLHFQDHASVTNILVVIYIADLQKNRWLLTLWIRLLLRISTTIFHLQYFFLFCWKVKRYIVH